MKFKLETLSGEWKEQYGTAFSDTFDAVNRYRPGSVEFTSFDGVPVMKRNFLKGNIGAGPNNPPDFWFLRGYFPEKETAATMVVWLYFPVGFFSKTRKGKLPISFQSEGMDKADKGTQDMVKFAHGSQPPEFSSHTMIWTDRDEKGNQIPLKQLDPNRNTARIGGYIYGEGINRPNGVKDVPCPVQDFVLTEGEWIGIAQILVLNSPGKSNGSLTYYFHSSQTDNRWKTYDLLFPLNGSNETGGQVLTANTLHWTNTEKIECANLSWFMGGGLHGMAKDGADGPDEDVSAYLKSAETWPAVDFSWNEDIPVIIDDVPELPGNDPTEAELIARLTAQVAALQKQIEDAQTNLSIQQAVNKELNDTIQELRLKLEKVKENIPVLEAGLRSLSTVLSDLKYAFPNG